MRESTRACCLHCSAGWPAAARRLATRVIACGVALPQPNWLHPRKSWRRARAAWSYAMRPQGSTPEDSGRWTTPHVSVAFMSRLPFVSVVRPPLCATDLRILHCCCARARAVCLFVCVRVDHALPSPIASETALGCLVRECASVCSRVRVCGRAPRPNAISALYCL